MLVGKRKENSRGESSSFQVSEVAREVLTNVARRIILHYDRRHKNTWTQRFIFTTRSTPRSKVLVCTTQFSEKVHRQKIYDRIGRKNISPTISQRSLISNQNPRAVLSPISTSESEIPLRDLQARPTLYRISNNPRVCDDGSDGFSRHNLACNDTVCVRRMH